MRERMAYICPQGQDAAIRDKGSDQMICPNCKNEVTGKYCSYCGTLLQPEAEIREKNSDPADPENFPWEEMNLGQTTQQIQASVVLSEALRGKTPQQFSNEDNFRDSDGEESGKSAGRSGEDAAGSLPRRTGKKNGQDSAFRMGASSGKVNVKQTTKKKTKVKKKGKNPLSSVLSSAASAAKGGTRTIWKTAIMFLQGICFVLLAYLTIRFAGNFWKQRDALGSVWGILSERNLAAAVYVGAALCTAGFGTVQALWTLGRKKLADHGRVLRLDAGRGMTGFLGFLILGLAARYVVDLFPSAPWPFLGVRQYFLLIEGMGSSLVGISVLGIVLCIVRKVGAR